MIYKNKSVVTRKHNAKSMIELAKEVMMKHYPEPLSVARIWEEIRHNYESQGKTPIASLHTALHRYSLRPNSDIAKVVAGWTRYKLTTNVIRKNKIEKLLNNM